MSCWLAALRTLIIGDGNFSFSAAYQARFPQTLTVATSFDSFDDVSLKYKEFPRIHRALQANNTTIVVHNVNAMDIHGSLARQHCQVVHFDRVIFNFPHLGVEDLHRHQSMLGHFFKSCVRVLNDTQSLIIVSLQQHQAQRWCLMRVAELNSLHLVHRTPMMESEWRGYEVKRHQVDKAFPLHDSFMYVFCRDPHVKFDDSVVAAVGVQAVAESKSKRKKSVALPKNERKRRAVEMRTRKYNPDGTLVKHTCDVCCKEFVLEYGLMNHMKSKHATSGGSSKNSQTSVDVACDDAPPDESVICEVCSQEFNSVHAVKDHARAKHSDIVNIVADIPDIEFASHGSWSSLVTNNSDFKCNICGVYFTNNEALEHHVQGLVPTSGKRKYECHMCSRLFSEERALVQHLTATHSSAIDPKQ